MLKLRKLGSEGYIINSNHVQIGLLMDVADSLANIEYNPLFFYALLSTAITFIFLKRIQGKGVSVRLLWCNKANVASTDQANSQ